MPRHTVGSLYRTCGGWGIRWPEQGKRQHRAGFKTKTDARRWFAQHVAQRLERGMPWPTSALTLAELVELYLERHAAAVRPRTITTLRDRLRHAVAAFGDEPLRDFERMADEIAGWQAKLPPRAGHGIAQALRQVLDAAVRWGHISVNPAKLAGPNPKPPRRPVRAYTFAELDAIAAELHPRWRPLPAFGAATGLRPEEWQAAERSDVDRDAGVMYVRRTVSPTGSSSSARSAAPAARCRCRREPSRLSTSCRPGWTRAYCSRPSAAAC